jgi:hypothetical protein
MGPRFRGDDGSFRGRRQTMTVIDITSRPPDLLQTKDQTMPLSSEKIARMRQQYIDRVPVAQILAENEVDLGSLYYWLDGGPKDPARRLPPIPRRGPRRHGSGDSAEARRQLVARLWRTAQQQVREIEERLKNFGQQPSEPDRDVRAFAVMIKTLRELAAFDEANRAAQPRTEPEDDEPRDMDEFRRELARNMEAIISRREG